jgi:hypothetical protein
MQIRWSLALIVTFAGVNAGCAPRREDPRSANADVAREEWGPCSVGSRADLPFVPLQDLAQTGRLNLGAVETRGYLMRHFEVLALVDPNRQDVVVLVEPALWEQGLKASALKNCIQKVVYVQGRTHTVRRRGKLLPAIKGAGLRE